MVPWWLYHTFCQAEGAVAGWLALGPAADSATGVIIFAAIGAVLLTPWQVLSHPLLGWGWVTERTDTKAIIIRGGAVLGIAARYGFGGWVLGALVTALVPWCVQDAGPATRVGLGIGFGLFLGIAYRALLGPENRAEVAPSAGG
jgi:hypothetical protein